MFSVLVCARLSRDWYGYGMGIGMGMVWAWYGHGMGLPCLRCLGGGLSASMDFL